MLPTVHLKDEVKPGQTLLTLSNLSHGMMQVLKCTLIGSLQMYTDHQELKNLEIHQLVAEQSDNILPCTHQVLFFCAYLQK